jgi:hypothetical protein
MANFFKNLYFLQQTSLVRNLIRNIDSCLYNGKLEKGSRKTEKNGEIPVSSMARPGRFPAASFASLRMQAGMERPTSSSAGNTKKSALADFFMVRPGRFERPTSSSAGKRSIRAELRPHDNSIFYVLALPAERPPSAAIRAGPPACIPPKADCGGYPG